MSLAVRNILSFLVAAVCLLVDGAGWALEVPALTGRIMDGAGLLPADVEATLSAELAAHEQRTGNQVVVLTLPSLEGEPLEEYSHRVATTWKLGRKGTDDGVLLLVVPGERRIRIEVGYGLEGTLTDVRSAQIIRREMVPRFRAGDFPGGITAGVRAVLGTIEGTYAAREQDAPQPANAGGREIFIVAVVIGVLVGAIIGGRWKPGGVLGSVVTFLMSSPLGWLLAIVAAVLVLIVVLFLVTPMAGRRRRRSDAFWTASPWGGTGSGDFSGGGFSGGGGDFGGGGASGRW